MVRARRQHQRQQEEERKRSLEQQESEARASNEKALADFRQEASDFLETNKADYELINMHGGQNIVLATIEQHYINTNSKGKPEIMSLKQASDLVEEYLAGEVEKTIKTAKRFNKVSNDDKGQASESKGATSSPTLSNALTSSSAPSLLPPKTEQARMERALAVLSKAS
jgi:hypothetical protein